MKCEKLFDEIDKLNDQYIRIWEEVCNIESPTHFKEGVDKVGNYFVKLAEKHGFEVEVLKQSVSGNAICITMNPDTEAAPVCFSGHIDTVHEVGSFGSPAVKMDDENIYGPGVTDCKGGVVASFMAMVALKKCGFTERPVKLIIQSDEETGSKGSDKQTIAFMCEKAKGAVAFLNAEVAEKGHLVLERKGIVRYQFTINGKAVHSAECYEGASAVTEAAYKIIEFEKNKNKDGITCNCIISKGGTVANTVPDECVFQVDVRYASQEEFKEVQAMVDKICNETHVEGCTCTAVMTSDRPALVATEKNRRLYEKMSEIYKENGLPEAKVLSAMGGSDASYITECGIPCVDSVGIEGFNIHSAKEYAGLNMLARAAKRLAAVAYCI